MKYCTPESAGVPSEAVKKFILDLERRGLSTHSILLARGDSIFAECYFKPFDENTKHRMYSISKSFVSVAIGFCEQDGLLSLDDPMVKYFPDYVKGIKEEDIPKPTIREMLKMETGNQEEVWWFGTGTDDRTEVYFRPTVHKYPNTIFSYDSSGSYMLGVIVERVTGMSFLEYLKEKVLLDIGFSPDAYCLKVPGGHSWGDSGVVCTPRDLMLFARFVLNMGVWEGKQYLNEEYLRLATTPSVANDYYGFEMHGIHGYGYQFWGAPHGCFAMFGMGTQIALMDPLHDLILVINSDNQGNPHGYEMVFESFFNVIYPGIGEPIPENPEIKAELDAYISGRELFFVKGNKESPFAELISGKEFFAASNPMGIKRFTLELSGDKGVFRYENATGMKELAFAFGRNEFGLFPEEGYSDMIGTVPAPGNRYTCAASADWQEEKKLRIRVQIIDKYLGNLAIVFGFRDERHVSVSMVKCAEAFLNEYQGILMASRE